MPTESQLQDPRLRQHVCELIENGRLPVMLSEHISAGYGSGHRCVACDLPITNVQIEYEVSDCRDGRPLSFHMGCHVVWQLECAQRRAKTPSPV